MELDGEIDWATLTCVATTTNPLAREMEDSSLHYLHCRESIHNYIPTHYLQRRSAEKWVEALRHESEKHKIAALTPAAAEQKYLEVVRQWDRYGACGFFATVPIPGDHGCWIHLTERLHWSQRLQEPKQVMLAVDCNGFHVLHPPNLVPLESYPFNKIANWAPSEHEFGVVVGSLMNPTRLVFYTKEVRPLCLLRWDPSL